ncbi:MAG: fibronectin type III domain-containing protein, partial [Candidatus Nanopelagicales bacterium]
GNTMYMGTWGGFVDGINANHVMRLTSTRLSDPAATTVSGAWDYLKSSGVVGVSGPATPTQPNQMAVRAALALPDGSVMFGGNFSQAGAVTAGRVATFIPGAEPSPYDPVYPPGPTTNVVATAGWNTVTVDWKAPTYVGSYPITNYLVTSSPGNRVCISSLSDVKLTQCTYRDLSPGTPYRFTVQALNGGGWGTPSEPSNVVAPRNLRIVAADRKQVKVLFFNAGTEVRASGVAPGFTPGTKIVPWTKIGDAAWSPAPTSSLAVDAASRFTWSRKFAQGQNSKAIAIKFEIGGNFSNTVNFRPVK